MEAYEVGKFYREIDKETAYVEFGPNLFPPTLKIQGRVPVEVSLDPFWAVLSGADNDTGR
jgi:hypothetical protein